MINVLVSQSFSFIENRNEERNFIDLRLVKFLNKCNLNVILAPNSPENLKRLMKIKNIGGVILSGGNDIFFNKSINKKKLKLKNLTKKRNLVEKKLFMFSRKKKIPIIGICRGFQYLNIINGGKIIKVNNHVAKRHKILIPKEPKYLDFKKLIDKNVNSFHNFGITKEHLAKKFDILASSNNFIEAAINIKESQLGVMWHPERDKKFSKKSIQLFRKFLRA